MRRIIFILGIAMVGLLLPAVVSNIRAQSDRPLVADVPFSFHVCREQLPAGKYTVEKVSRMSQNVLVVKSKDGRSVDLVCTKNVENPRVIQEGMLTFNRYGDQYFLSQAWWPGDKLVLEMVKSHREEALIKELSPIDPKEAKKRKEKVTIKLNKQ